MSEHKCLHEEDWGSVKTNVLNICRDVKIIKDHAKAIAQMRVWIYVMWVAMTGMFIWNLRLHGLW